ncbi:MAG: agmatine deiminase family protein [Nitrospinaceae bacterium]
MPAEWEPHSGTWLTWPHNRETWAPPDLGEVENLFLDMIRILAEGEWVHLLVNDDASRERVLQKFKNEKIPADRVQLHLIPTNDAWIRDYGPNFIIRSGVRENPIAINQWGFDSWGKKYEWELDANAGTEIALRLEFQRFQPGIVLEGGAIEVNGRGTCLTTASCLLNPNRNGGLTREIMEDYLKDYLGVQKIIWLNGGIEGDDTDGHIDNLARFIAPNTILCAYEEDPADKNHEILKKNYQALCNATDPHGNRFEVIRLPMPGKVQGHSGRLPASYANFYIGNRTVLLPVFGHANDQRALALLQESFPERDVAVLPCRKLLIGLGGIHCVTQQQPLAPAREHG